MMIRLLQLLFQSLFLYECYYYLALHEHLALGTSLLIIKASKTKPSAAPKILVDATIIFLAIAPLRHFYLVYEDDFPELFDRTMPEPKI